MLGRATFTTDVERVLFALVANRAIDPMLEAVRGRVGHHDAAIPGLEAMDEDQAYRAMDLLVEADAQAQVQEAVFFAVADLLNLEVDVLFFDTTSTYFERDTEDEATTASRVPPVRALQGPPPDLPQIVIGLAVTKEGIPVRCWCWPGNTADGRCCPRSRTTCGTGVSGRVVTVVDRGFSSDREPGLPAPRRWALHRRGTDAGRYPSVDRPCPAGPLPAGPGQPARQGSPPRRHA